MGRRAKTLSDIDAVTVEDYEDMTEEEQQAYMLDFGQATLCAAPWREFTEEAIKEMQWWLDEYERAAGRTRH